MNKRAALNRLMHHAFIDIREQSVDKDPKSFYLSDLFHNIPTRLEAVASGDMSVDDVWESLHEHARRRGGATLLWLQARIEVVNVELRRLEQMSSNDDNTDAGDAD